MADSTNSPIDVRKFRELRKRAGLTQDDLSQRLGVTRQAVANYEKGKRTPDLWNARDIAEILGCTIDDLLI